MKSKNKVTIKNRNYGDTTFLKSPKARNVLAKYNLPCLHCPMAAFEMGRLKIREVAETYGIDLKKLVGELNKTRETAENE